MAVDLTKMKRTSMEQGIQRPKLPVDDMGGFTGSQDLFMSYPMRELLISNDDATASLTFTISGDDGSTATFTLQAGDVLDERFYPFKEVNITATGAWRYIVRSGVIT